MLYAIGPILDHGANPARSCTWPQAINWKDFAGVVCVGQRSDSHSSFRSLSSHVTLPYRACNCYLHESPSLLSIRINSSTAQSFYLNDLTTRKNASIQISRNCWHKQWLQQWVIIIFSTSVMCNQTECQIAFLVSIPFHSRRGSTLTTSFQTRLAIIPSSTEIW